MTTFNILIGWMIGCNFQVLYTIQLTFQLISGGIHDAALISGVCQLHLTRLHEIIYV